MGQGAPEGDGAGLPHAADLDLALPSVAGEGVHALDGRANMNQPSQVAGFDLIAAGRFRLIGGRAEPA
jgi:hypothetical protein